MREDMAAAWSGVAEFTKAAQEKGMEAVTWAVHISASMASAGVTPPSPELAHVLVSHICWDNDVPYAWKYLEKAIAFSLAPPMLLLALLTSRVIRNRHSRAAAYRLYLEILSRHAFSYASQIRWPNFKKIMQSIDDELHLSEEFGIQASEPGSLVVEYVFCIVWHLVDATLDDEALLELTPEKKSRWPIKSQEMDVDGEDYCLRNGYNETLQKLNSAKAIELILKFLQHKEISRLLHLARENMWLSRFGQDVPWALIRDLGGVMPTFRSDS